MSYYQMLKSIHIIINTEEKLELNFWAEEVYEESEFVESFLNVNLLLEKGICMKVDTIKKQGVNDSSLLK